MKMQLPLTIDNGIGETLTFQSVEITPDGEKVNIVANCKSGCGPAMHTHFKQDEALTIVKGKMAYQILGQQTQYIEAGETVLFKRGTPHRFWAVDGEVHFTATVQPANSFIYFLSAVYAAQKKSGNEKPEAFDGAFLLTTYASEYDMPEIPVFVKKVIFPITVFIGRLLGKYNHFVDAPAPVK